MMTRQRLLTPAALKGAVPAQIGIAVLLFVSLAADGLGQFFSGDDLMNLYKYLTQPLAHWLKGIALFWSSDYYRPFGAFAYLVPYRLFGFHPLPFRLVAFALLLLNLGLCFRFAAKITRSAYWGSFVLLLCAYHSACAGLYQSYGTIYDITSYSFFFGGLLGYIAWREAVSRRSRNFGLALAFACFWLGVAAKETVIALPAVMAAYDLVLEDGFKRDKWKWPWRGGWPIVACSLLGIVYLVGKLTGPDSLVKNPLYEPHFTLQQYSHVTAHYMGELFYLPEGLPTPLAALIVLGVLLAASLLLRSRVMLFSFISILLTQLPVAFIAPRGGFAIYIAWTFWALYAVGLLASVSRPFRRPAFGAAVFAALAGLLFVVHLRMKPRFDADFTAGSAGYQEFSRHLDAWGVQVPRTGHVFLANDPFPPHWSRYDLLFLLSLHAGTTRASVVRGKYETAFPPASEMSRYDYVLDYQDQWRLLKGPGHPLTASSIARIEALAQKLPVRLAYGFALPVPDAWRRTEERFGMELTCPHPGRNWLIVSLMAPEPLMLSAEENSSKLFEGSLPAGRTLPFGLSIDAAAAGEVHRIDFHLRRRAAGARLKPGILYFDAHMVTPIQDPPTASFLISKNGGPFTNNVTAAPGDTITYRWNSTNGVFFSSVDAVSPSEKDRCGNASGPIGFTTASGTSPAHRVEPCQAGFTYTMTYTAAGYGPPASATVTILVK